MPVCLSLLHAMRSDFIYGTAKALQRHSKYYAEQEIEMVIGDGVHISTKIGIFPEQTHQVFPF